MQVNRGPLAAQGKILKKRITLEVDFSDVRQTDSGAYKGGVADPLLASDDVVFRVARKAEESLFEPISGRLQVNLYGTARGYRELV